jgi:formate dehydrogenase iron-sulfur subunit
MRRDVLDQIAAPGDGEVIAQIYKERVSRRGYGSGAWGWQTAYGETIAT